MKYTIGIGALIDTTSFNRIREIEFALADKIGNLAGLGQPPHVTIKRPFDVETIEAVEHCRQLMNELADKTQPFDIVLKGIGHFGDSVLYLQVEQNDHLSLMHNNLLDTVEPVFSGSTGVFERDKMIFHSTLAMGLTTNQFSQGRSLLEAYSAKELSLTTTVQKVGLFLGLDDNSHWVIISEKSLA